MTFPPVLQTQWGDFQVSSNEEDSLTITGNASMGGQGYQILLRLYLGADGWVRRGYDDLQITKVGGINSGKPARLAAREIVVDYLPELVNSVIGGG